jgi:hypothetical protein
VENEEEFLKIPRLRIVNAADGTPIAKLVSHKRCLDHLFFHGPGVLGIYYEYATVRAATSARNFWRFRCGRRFVKEFRGEQDGIILFRITRLGDIPREFFISERGKMGGGRSTPRANEIDSRTRASGVSSQFRDS